MASLASSPLPDHPRSPFSHRPTLPFDLNALGKDWKKQSAQDGSHFALFTRDIERSLNDKREYRLIRLGNGLEALLVSDPTLDKGAVSLSVGVGHLSDPDDLPGLAHFCEHMLFLGTEKFPEEAAYKLFLAQNAGSANAFTSLDETNYHLNVHPSAIPGDEGILARHSQFFIAPLFLESCTEREVKAVDSEFRRNLMLDSRRLFQLGKATSNRDAGAKYWKFGTGSIDTLRNNPVGNGVNVRERLLEWYAANYSANLMKLTVLSTQPVDELQDLVLKNYSPIPNLNLAPPHFPVSPIGPKQFKTEVSFRTIKDAPLLRIEFPFPDQEPLWESKPGNFISHLVGHEGPHSCLALLKKKGWASSLSSSGSGHGAAGFETFRITVDLTASGLEHYKEVAQYVFSYLQIIKSTPPQEWSFDETAALGRVGWRWKEHGQPESTAQNFATKLHSLYDRDKIFSAAYYATKFDQDLIQKCLDHLDEDRARVFIGSKEVLKEGSSWELKEEHYGTEYTIQPLQGVNPEKSPQELGLDLPGPNPFIPEKLELVPQLSTPDKLNRPSLIRKTSTSRLFFKQDSTWLVPRASAYFMLQSPVADTSPSNAVKTQIFASLVEEALADRTYDASLAGLDFSVGSDPEGLQVCVGGYSEKLPVLIDVILTKLKGLQADPTMFEIVHDRIFKSYANAQLSNPNQIGETFLRHATRQTYWTYDERLEALKGLKPIDIDQHANDLLQALDIDALVHGNVTRDQAISMMKLVEGHLQPAEVPAHSMDYHRPLLLPKGSNFVIRPPVFSPENVNSSAIIYYEVAFRTEYKLRMKLALFAQIAKVPIFSTLRTKEQLGYIVSSGLWVYRGLNGFRVQVQSERTGEYLEERIEALWETFGDYLIRMSDEDFAKQRKSLVDSKLEKPKNLGQETNRFWDQIELGQFDFGFRERDASIISELTKDDILDFFNTFISPASSSRSKLSVLMRSQRFQPDLLHPIINSLPENLRTRGQETAASKPTIDQLKKFVASLDVDGTTRAKLEVGLEKVASLPLLKDGAVELSVGELDEFRKKLEKADKVVPVDEMLGDLLEAPHL